MALEVRGIRLAKYYGVHSLRPGAARELVENGADLATLLKAGGWNSAAFRPYPDMVGLGKSVCQARLEALFDGDEGE